MADKIEYSRMLVKRTAQTGEVPTIPPVTAVTLNQFIPTDLFVGELFLNETDDLLWIRTDNGILPISLSGSTGTTVNPTLMQVLFQGNITNGYNIEVSNGDTIVFSGLSSGATTQFLGLDASGNTIISTVTPGTPDLEDVLTIGNTTGANDISVNVSQKVKGQSGGNWIQPETGDGNLEINVNSGTTELTILGITSGVTDIVLSYDPDTKYVRYQSISGGSSGSAGTSGTSGTSGSAGTNGTSGTSGSGTSGTSGLSGVNGTNGTSGTSGVNGTAGTNGSSGTSGTNGSSGTSGTSAINPIGLFLPLSGGTVTGNTEIIAQSWVKLPTTGNTTSSTTINWNNGNVQEMVLNVSATTFTFSNPNAGGTYILILRQRSSGGGTVTFPGTVTWAGGTTPTMTSTANKYDVYTFVYDGSKYFGSYVQDFT